MIEHHTYDPAEWLTKTYVDERGILHVIAISRDAEPDHVDEDGRSWWHTPSS